MSSPYREVLRRGIGGTGVETSSLGLVDLGVKISYVIFCVRGEYEMPDISNTLSEFYRRYDETKGGSASDFVAMCADEISMSSIGGPVEGAEFLENRKSRADLESYFSGLFETWEMNHFTVKDIIVDGNRAVVLSDVAFTFKATGKRVNSPKADVFGFEDGKIVSFFEFFDTAAFRDALT